MLNYHLGFLIPIKRGLTLKRKNAQKTFLPFAGIFEGIKTVDYPYRFTKTAKQDTSQMQTKQKPQATHIFTQRLIEIRTDTKRQKTRANAEM